MTDTKRPNRFPPDEMLHDIVAGAFESAVTDEEHPVDDEDLLARWMHESLSEREHEELLDHLARCSDCRTEIAEMVRHGILTFQATPQEDAANYRTKKRKPYRSLKLFGVVMSTSLCFFICCLFFFTGDTPPSVDPGNDSVRFRGAADTETERFALLVGINRYGKLPEKEWLDGCRNDIETLRPILVERFGFKPENVKTLLDERATAEGIRTGLENLVRSVRSRPPDAPPAQVVLYFSGHGSRIADQPEGHPDCDSEDGFDSTLVVYDSEKQGGDTDIRDDELNRFAHELCKDGRGELLIVLDSCHSGGGARGITKFRGLQRENDAPSNIDPARRKFTPKTLPPGTVFLSACQSNQKEPEFQHEGKPYGLLSFHLAELLRSERIVSNLDYSTLKDAVHRSYQRNKIAQAPTPTVEGNPRDLKKTVFGADRSVDRKPYWEVFRDAKNRGGLRMEAGKIDDITPRSLFELYETVEQAVDPEAVSLGWFEITQVDGKFSLGEFFRWNDEKRSDRTASVLPNDFKTGFAVQRYRDYGENRLRVRVVDARSDKTLRPGSTEVPDSVRKLLDNSGTKIETAWIRWTGDGEDCDVVLRFDTGARLAAIFPAIGCAEDDRAEQKTRTLRAVPESLRGGWGPVAWGTEQGKRELLDNLRRIMKGLTLKRLVAEKSGESATKTRGDSASPLFSVSVFRQLGNSVEPVEIDSRRGIVLDGGEDDWYQLRIRNNDAKPLYVTILCIDPNMQIDPFAFGPESNPVRFDPSAGTGNDPSANRLESGAEFVSSFGFQEPFGLHTLIVLATREPGNFSHFAQAGLERTRSLGAASSKLLQFFEDECSVGTRAVRRPAPPRDDAWSVGTIDVISRPGR